MKRALLTLISVGLLATGCSSLSGSRMLSEEEMRERGLKGEMKDMPICEKPAGPCEYVTCIPNKEGTALKCTAAKNKK